MPPRRFDEVLVEASTGTLRAAAVADGRLVDWMAVSRHEALAAGTIVRAKVVGLAADLGAAFVDVGGAQPALLANRAERLSDGEAVTVQIVEPPSDGKGGRVTQRLALPGLHTVLLCGGKGLAASKRLAPAAAARLGPALSAAVPPGHGVLLRWTAEFASPQDIAAEMAQLAEAWRQGAAATASVISDDGDGLARLLRELGAHGHPAFVFNDRTVLRAAEKIVERSYPALVGRLGFADEATHDRHDIASQLAEAEATELTLRGGGRMSIERTRAGTMVDVDSAGGSASARARLATNLDAARALARQLWLRDLGGLVVVDFIRQDDALDRSKIVSTLTESFSSDRAPVQVLGWTRGGTVELVRQRTRGGAAVA